MFIDTFQLKGRHNFVSQIFVHICHLLLFHKVEKSVLALVPMSKSNFFDDSFHDRQNLWTSSTIDCYIYLKYFILIM